MATSGGPNITTEGLVFGYDTGYPMVSGNSDTYKFNRGDTGNLGAGTASYPYISIMGRYTGTSSPAEGDISTVKLYNRALSLEEVLQNYNATKSRFNL